MNRLLYQGYICYTQVIYEVVASTLLYAAPALRIGRYEQILIKAQRRALLRVAMAYRTVSTAAVQVITGVSPITLLAEERGRRFRREDRGTAQAKREEREVTMAVWQRKWEANADGKGQWTRTLIPQLDRWVKCPHKNLGYFVTQVLSGHGSFGTYTLKIKKTANDHCVYCEGEIVDSPAHTLFVCNRWAQERGMVERELGETLDHTNMTQCMMESAEKWGLIEKFINNIMRKKETEERERQRGVRV